MKLVTRHLSFATALALLASAGVRAETVTIASAADWKTFADRVNAGETALDAQLTANVLLDNSAPLVGTPDQLWAGTFHGSGHTLTLDWNRTEDYAAPFRFTAGCVIQDLHVAGTLKTSSWRAGGFLGRPRRGNRDTLIERCRASLTIESTFRDGQACTGGFIGYTYWESMTIRLTDCLFDGRLLGPNATNCGGFFGFNSNDPYIYLTRCLFDPQELTMSSSGAYTFGKTSSASHLNLSKAYYTRTFGTSQGTSASSMSAEALVAALGSEWTVWCGKAMLGKFSVFEPAVAGFVYQGALRDAQGGALAEKNHVIEFRLYDAATGGRALWARACPVLLDDAGLFNAALHDEGGDAIADEPGTGLPGILASHDGATLYVGLTVAGSGAEIAPRQKLLSAPYATRAADLFAAKGDFAAAGTLSAATAKVAGLVDAASLKTSGAVKAGGDVAVGDAVSGYGTMPVGGIAIWSGYESAIPGGWALCNGRNGTPDLRSRFVVGAGGEYAVGATGGEKTHTLAESEMPSHSHSYSYRAYDLDLSWKDQSNFYAVDKGDNWKSASTASAGGSQPHENRPPYYALCYIMRVR